MFIGEYQHNLDDKGRVALPAKFRPMLKDGAVVTRGVDKCLTVYPKKDWLKEAEKISALPKTKADARAFSRLTLGGAMALDLDAQGRVVLPEYLRDYATLTKPVVVVGMYDRFEIWSENLWRKFKQQAETSSVAIAEKLVDLDV